MTLYLKSVFKDPLTHFLLIGAGLFGLYQLQADESGDSQQRIEITAQDLDIARERWRARWHRLPTAEQLRSSIERQIREEVFYREAVALGLGRDDAVVRRRLAEKMEFIASDLLTPKQPSEEALQGYLTDQQDEFSSPDRFSFRHIYFNPDLHEGDIALTAQHRLQQLQAMNNTENDAVNSGDVFAGKSHYRNLPDHQINRLLGRNFSAQLLTLPLGEWAGPVASGYGQHLVLVEAHTPAKPLPLNQVREKVIAAWRADAQKKANDSLYARFRDNYDIVIAPYTDDALTIAERD